MSRGELLDACKRIAPDFAIQKRVSGGERIVEATCTYAGRRLKLSMVDGTFGDRPAELHVLTECLADLRARETTGHPS